MRFTVGKLGRFFVLLQVLLLIEAVSCVMCSENRIVLQNSQNNQICARSSIPVDFSANPLLQINEQMQNVNQIEEQNSVIVERSVIPNKEGKTSFLVKKIFREVDNGIRICVGEEKEELANKYKVFKWEHDDSALTSRALTQMYVKYDGTAEFIDDVPLFRERSHCRKYTPKDCAHVIKKTKFDEERYKCELCEEYKIYVRHDGSEYEKKVGSSVKKIAKPIKTETVKWTFNDTAMSGIPILQDYVVDGTKRTPLGGTKKGGVLRYKQKERIVVEEDDLKFQNGVLVKDIVEITKYERPDKSIFEKSVNLPQIRVQIQDPVTFVSHGWSIVNASRMAMGTYKCNNGEIKILDGSQIREYKRDGTVRLRPALPDELVALAPTKLIPVYKRGKGGGVFRHNKWKLQKEREEVLLSSGLNSIGINNSTVYMDAIKGDRSMNGKQMSISQFKVACKKPENIGSKPERVMIGLAMYKKKKPEVAEIKLESTSIVGGAIMAENIEIDGGHLKISGSNVTMGPCRSKLGSNPESVRRGSFFGRGKLVEKKPEVAEIKVEEKAPEIVQIKVEEESPRKKSSFKVMNWPKKLHGKVKETKNEVAEIKVEEKAPKTEVRRNPFAHLKDIKK